MDSPKRVQLSRRKGWKMPPNTIKVDRSTMWGNPFPVTGRLDAGYCVEAFRAWLGPSWRIDWDGPQSERARAIILDNIGSLRGKNLACWCKIGDPCHADVLLELANPTCERATT